MNALLVGSLPLAWAVPGAAQICAGGPSFNFAPRQLGAAAAKSSTDQTAAFTAGFGTDRLFAAGAIGASAARGGEAALTTEIGAGSNQPLRVDNRLQFCPRLAVTRTWGEGRAATDLTGYIEGGWLARNRSALSIVPSVGVGFGTRTSFRLSAGVGFIVRTRYAITPRFIVKWQGGEPAAGAGVALVMGAR